MAATDPSDPEYYENFRIAQNFRQEIVNNLGALDPEVALDFLRSTRGWANPEGGAAQRRFEQGLESQLMGQLAAKDPRRSFQMAEDSLKTGGLTDGWSGSFIRFPVRTRNWLRVWPTMLRPNSKPNG
jgi:hypothetical protein